VEASTAFPRVALVFVSPLFLVLFTRLSPWAMDPIKRLAPMVPGHLPQAANRGAEVPFCACSTVSDR
jgi:hypothetical protein